MSFKLDYAYIGLDAEPCNLKTVNSENAGTESGIESASSSSSLDELSKEVQQTNKPIVTGVVYIPPQISNSKGTELSGRASTIDLVVMYRGKVEMPNPVPYERLSRTRTMKLHAKTLQNNQHCRFLKMRIEEESIKFYPLDPLPQTLLLEIQCHQLDLVKQSRKDICFFYFTTDTTRKLDMPPSGSDCNFSGYTLYVFHGTCPKTADRAHRLIKNFIDLKMKAQIYSLNQNCNLAAQPEPVTIVNHISELKVIKPSIEHKPELQKPSPVTSSVDLLLNIDDLFESTDITSPVSMFDNLAPASVNKCNTETSKNLDLLGEILSPQVNPEDNLFAKQHLNYSMQLANVVSRCSTGVQPAAVTDSVNPFMNKSCNNNLASLLSNSHPNKSSPQPSFINPFVQPQQMVPLVPMAPTKLVPNHPNLSSVQASAQVPNYSNSNPFGTSTVNTFTYPQYPSASSNPFISTNQAQPNVKLSSDFDEFLSQTMKAQFKK